MMRNVEAHPEEYIAGHIGKLQEIRDYIKMSLHDYLHHADLLDRPCRKKYAVLLRCLDWFINYLKKREADDKGETGRKIKHLHPES